MIKTPLLFALPLFVLLSACSDSTPEKPKEPPKPLEPLTGRQAFQKMYPMARNWALDAKPMRVRTLILSAKPEKGKADAWEATFVSVSLSKSKTFTYSTVESAGNLHQGVFAGLEEGYSGPQGGAFPFEIAAIKTDSDQAYDIAAEKSADYIKKNPNKPITYLMEQTRRFPDVTWRVIWGDSVSTSDYSVFVDASTGKYLEKAH
ncbi:MAG TPA: hypothetical protein VKT81_08115 [Bryobacteraceae bacterium]|nr:hypothetical protein [Bryobacteraceae bacterium]